MFISPAFAQTANATASGGGFASLVQFAPLVLIVIVFYFLLTRPAACPALSHSYRQT